MVIKIIKFVRVCHFFYEGKAEFSQKRFENTQNLSEDANLT